MEKEDRVKRYLAGESISSLARDYGVSRQAIIWYLKKEGVHGGYESPPKKVSKPKVKKVGVKDYSVPSYDIGESSDGSICKVLGGVVHRADFVVGGDKEEKLFTNVYISSKGCRVFDWKHNGWVTYKTFDALYAVYGA